METPTLETELFYAAADGGQIIVEGDFLRIGVGNFDTDDEYIDANNVTQRGPTIGLWVFVRGRPDLEQQLRAYEGQTFVVADHTIRVVEIDTADSNVTLGVIAPSEGEK